MITVSAILGKFWKVITIVCLGILSFFMVYFKGRGDQKNKDDKQAADAEIDAQKAIVKDTAQASAARTERGKIYDKARKILRAVNTPDNDNK